MNETLNCKRKNLIIGCQNSNPFEGNIVMLLVERVTSVPPKFLTVILISSIFGGFALVYSFFGFVSNESAARFDTFGSLTPQEIGGHFLFGYIVALPTRNLKIGVLAGLMALALDADHILNAAGFLIQGRMGHSIAFASISSVLIGFIATQIFRNIPLRTMPYVVSSSEKTEKKVLANTDASTHELYSAKNNIIFFQFMIITLAAYMSHIAYDVFVDTEANFPLLAPFNFSDILIAQIYAIPMEGVAIFLVYLWCMVVNKKIYSNQNL